MLICDRFNVYGISAEEEIFCSINEIIALEKYLDCWIGHVMQQNKRFGEFSSEAP
jgi:hypothetical protein